MQFSIIPIVAFATIAQGAILKARDFSGCAIQLESTVDNPADTGEIIALGALSKWNSATGQAVSSTQLDLTNTTSSPYSVGYLANAFEGYETNELLRTVLDPWVGTYLRGDATPNEDEDFLITEVDCY
ncbi:hypothetical protein GGR57DRAFT_471110 [Xylariaceae sp. FL1272]|nr:hypothetical protein GGR57DRAFT_471110 [Xylariaceae sp. FL1272]